MLIYIPNGIENYHYPSVSNDSNSSYISNKLPKWIGTYQNDNIPVCMFRTNIAHIPPHPKFSET